MSVQTRCDLKFLSLFQFIHSFIISSILVIHKFILFYTLCFLTFCIQHLVFFNIVIKCVRKNVRLFKTVFCCSYWAQVKSFMPKQKCSKLGRCCESCHFLTVDVFCTEWLYSTFYQTRPSYDIGSYHKTRPIVNA